MSHKFTIFYISLFPAIVMSIFFNGILPDDFRLWEGFGAVCLGVIGLYITIGSLIFATHPDIFSTIGTVLAGFLSIICLILTVVFYFNNADNLINNAVSSGALGLVISFLFCWPRFREFMDYFYSV